jgi:hypothetical protein
MDIDVERLGFFEEGHAAGLLSVEPSTLRVNGSLGSTGLGW